MCPVVVRFSASPGVAGPGAARARRRPRAARRRFGQATPRRRSPASRAPAAVRRRGPAFRPGRGWFCPCLGFGPGAFRAPSARLPRAFRRETPRKARPAGFRSSARAGRCQLEPPGVRRVRSCCANCAGTGPATHRHGDRRREPQRARTTLGSRRASRGVISVASPAETTLGLRKAPDAKRPEPAGSQQRALAPSL